jgi:hypothetical protein
VFVRWEERYPVGVVGEFTLAHGSLRANPLGGTSTLAFSAKSVRGIFMAAKRSGSPKSHVAGPPEGELRDLLGRCYAVFDRVAHPSHSVTGEWRCYKKGTPPILKVIDGKRTLYYVRPDRGSVHVSLLLGRLACEAALAGQVPSHLHAVIRSAKEFPEGRAVRLELHRLADVADVEALLAVKLAPATAAGAT